jgi:hypothetical protein
MDNTSRVFFLVVWSFPFIKQDEQFVADHKAYLSFSSAIETPISVDCKSFVYQRSNG